MAFACTPTEDLPDDPAPEDENLADGLSMEVVAEEPGDLAGITLAALDADRVAVVQATALGDTFCFDCADLPPGTCPDLCERVQITAQVRDVTADILGEEIPVATVYPRTFDHYAGELAVAPLGEDKIGVAWLDCDGATCFGLMSSISCTAYYRTVDLVTGQVSPVSTLFASRFAKLWLTAAPERNEVLAIASRDAPWQAGVRAAVIDADTGTLLTPWSSLGGPAAMGPAAVAVANGFTVLVDDANPTFPPRDTPCATSCDCFDVAPIDLEAGGLYAYDVSTSGVSGGTLVASGLDDRGFYGRRERIAVMATGQDVAVATTQSIDRSADLFVSAGGTWEHRGRWDAPLPVWIGIAGDGDTLSWLGPQVEPGEQATVQRLVAGIASPRSQAFTELSQPLDNHFFQGTRSVADGDGTASFLLRGVFEHSDGGTTWDRFEILRIQANWED